MKKIAITAMSSKGIGKAKEYFAEMAVDAITLVMEKRGESYLADLDDIQIMKKEGKNLSDSELVKGMVLDKEVVHPGMPKIVKNAKIILLDTALEIEKTEFSAEIRITDPSQMKAFKDQGETVESNRWQHSYESR
jgi:chaperonin GroEL (HSP60 family)